jgi:hypothetical protein
MPDRKLQFDSSNLDYGDAVMIAEREIRQNSSFEVEEILENQDNRAAFTSSNNAVSVALVNSTVVVDLNGSQMVMDAIEEALKEQSSGGPPARSGTGPTNPELGGTGPDDMEFTPSDPPSMPQPGEDIEQDRQWYIIVDEDYSMSIETDDDGDEPATRREQAIIGPFDQRSIAEQRETELTNALHRYDAEAARPILEQRFWVYADDDPALVDVLTQDGNRGKAEMPLRLATEAEAFGYAKVVEESAPDTRDLMPSRRPDYVTPRYLEEWTEIFRHLQPHPGDEPRVPSPVDDERVPQPQAEKEGRMSVAQREDPQAVAEIYQNGVVSLSREGSADTLDTSVGIFIDRQDNSVSMGYMAEFLDLSDSEVERIVENVRSFLEQNDG